MTASVYKSITYQKEDKNAKAKINERAKVIKIEIKNT
jgi:hypothetical protein